MRGRPFGTGRMVLRSTLKQARVTSTFTLETKLGIVRGRATARLTLDGDTATYKGTATITSGTRRYRGATGSNIRFTDVGPVSAKSTKITLTDTRSMPGRPPQRWRHVPIERHTPQVVRDDVDAEVSRSPSKLSATDSSSTADPVASMAVDRSGSQHAVAGLPRRGGPGCIATCCR